MERVDIFLLHEAYSDAVTPELVAFLGKLKQQGATDALGVGSLRAEVNAISQAHPSLATVQQFRWNVFEAPLDPLPGDFLITHGSIGPALEIAASSFAKDPKACARWSDAVGLDLADNRVLADVLLAAALAENKQGLVLIYSQSANRLRRASEVAASSALLEAGERLTQIVRREQA